MPRRPRLLTALVPITILALGTTLAHAQEKGSVSGKVIDKKNGHAIAFANVAVPAAQRGGLTDSEGQFLITGIPAGTYDVKVQYLGYSPDTRAGVVVTGGKATTVNFELQEIVVQEVKAIVVTGERRLVEVRQGATIRSVNASEIRNLPVQSITEVLQQQAGISTEGDQIHVRGGRADETVFVINGVSNRDLVTGQSTAGRLNARSVSEVNVATGAYDARYGNALSGVVEVKLKEGGDKLGGGLTFSNGSYGVRNFQGVVSGPDPVFGPLFSAVKLPGTVSSIVDVSGNLDETRYRIYTNGQNDGFFSALFNAPRHNRLRSSYEDSFFGHSFRYGDFFAPSQDNLWSMRYGMTWKPGNRDKVNINLSKRIEIDQGFTRSLISVTNDAEPAFPWRWKRRIDHAPTFLEDNVQSSIDWHHTISTTGFTEFQLSRYFFALRRDVMGKSWTEYEQPDDFGAFPDPSDPRRDTYFYDSGDDNTWQDRRTTTTSVQWSLSESIRKRHEFEVGLQHDFQTVQYVTIENPWEFDPEGLGSSHDLWRVRPMVGDVYIRDRLQYEGFTANVGLRGDYWFVGRDAERAVADPDNQNVTDATRAAFFRDTKSIFGRRAKIRFSPRIIVAHPITEHSSFFFNYGKFTQIPSYRYVYSKLTSVSSEKFPLLGNPNLNPQVSVNYEVGAKHQFLSSTAVNGTFFVKDVYDYPTATTFKRSSGGSLVDIFVYLNGHFARSKGFEVEVEKRRTGYWSGKLTYTYQQTKGKSSDPNEQQVVEEGGGDAAETRLSETFVRWNRPHKLAVNFDLRFDETAPEGWSWLKHTGINLYIQGQSGRAYTPISVFSTQAAEPFSKNAPVQLTTDLRLNRGVNIGGRRFDVSLVGGNIFDNRLIQRVDATTGLGIPVVPGYYNVNLISGGQVSYRGDDPSNYGSGAVWRLGLDYDF